MKWKTNWCHYFNFIHISTVLYMFRAHRPIFRGVHAAVHTTIGSVSVPFWSRVLYVHTERATRTVRILNQWLCEQLRELPWRWACGPETCREPSIYEWNWNSDISWFFISYAEKMHGTKSLKFIWSIYLLIMLDTLLLRSSLHFTQLHITPLHYTCQQLRWVKFKWEEVKCWQV